MGALLTIFKPEHTHQINFFLDFKNFNPPTGGEELDVYNAVKDVLDRHQEILQILTSYSGCDAVIRKAINENSYDEAFEVLVPAVQDLRTLYEFSQQIGEVAPRLLSPLCKSADEEGSLANQTALAKLLCDLFNFILQFDDKKMVNPHIQNDFSFFRRSQGKLKDKNISKVPEDVTNKMSLFYAYPTPMMTMLTDLVTNQGLVGISRDEIIQGLSLLANVCLDMVEKTKFDDNDLNLFCLRAMTAAIILVDHISENGVFHRRSPVNIKSAIITLRRKQDELQTTGLLNALKYTTRHLNDPDTPKSITNLLA